MSVISAGLAECFCDARNSLKHTKSDASYYAT